MVVYAVQKNAFVPILLFRTREDAQSYVQLAEQVLRENGSVVEDYLIEKCVIQDGMNFAIRRLYSAVIDLLTGEILERSGRTELSDRKGEYPNAQLSFYRIHQVEQQDAVCRRYACRCYVSQESADAKVRQLRQDLLQQWGGIENLTEFTGNKSDYKNTWVALKENPCK